jgi:hypothetical protein
MNQDTLKQLLSRSGITLKIDGTYSGDLDRFARLMELHTDYLDQLDAEAQASQDLGYGMN